MGAKKTYNHNNSLTVQVKGRAFPNDKANRAPYSATIANLTTFDPVFWPIWTCSKKLF